MRKYAKISPLFWTQGSGRRMRGDSDAQLLALHLVTGPSATMIGLYYLPIPSLAYELGWDIDRVSKALLRVCASGFAAYDNARDLVWVFKSVEFEFGDGTKLGAKTAKGIARQLEPFGNHPFVRDFLHVYGSRYRIAIKGLDAAPLDPKQMALPCLIDTPSAFGDQDQGYQVLPGNSAGASSPPVALLEKASVEFDDRPGLAPGHPDVQFFEADYRARFGGGPLSRTERADVANIIRACIDSQKSWQAMLATYETKFQNRKGSLSWLKFQVRDVLRDTPGSTGPKKSRKEIIAEQNAARDARFAREEAEAVEAYNRERAKEAADGGAPQR